MSPDRRSNQVRYALLGSLGRDPERACDLAPGVALSPGLLHAGHDRSVELLRQHDEEAQLLEGLTPGG